MNTRTANPDQINFQDNPPITLLGRIFSTVSRFNMNFKNAFYIQQQAKHFYAMSDTDLSQMGITREEIPAQLIKLYTN